MNLRNLVPVGLAGLVACTPELAEKRFVDAGNDITEVADLGNEVRDDVRTVSDVDFDVRIPDLVPRVESCLNVSDVYFADKAEAFRYQHISAPLADRIETVLLQNPAFSGLSEADRLPDVKVCSDETETVCDRVVSFFRAPTADQDFREGLSCTVLASAPVNTQKFNCIYFTSTSEDAKLLKFALYQNLVLSTDTDEFDVTSSLRHPTFLIDFDSCTFNSAGGFGIMCEESCDRIYTQARDLIKL